MTRPTMPVKLIRGGMTKETKYLRQQTEDRLRGAAFVPEIPEYFTPAEVAAYTWLYSILGPADILGAADRETVRLMAVTIARMDKIDQLIRDDTELLINKDVNRIRSAYVSQYFQLCKELCLTPSARSKVGAMAKRQKTDDPLIKVLNEQRPPDVP